MAVACPGDVRSFGLGLALAALVAPACGGAAIVGGDDGDDRADAGGGASGAGGGGVSDAATRPGDEREIHLIGRFERSDPARPAFDWSGSAIAARFDGGEIAVTLEDSGSNIFAVTIDGQPRPDLVTRPGIETYPLASGLGAGPHDLRLTRRTEASFGVNRLIDLSGATLIATPPETDRLIELVGDSITCGYGVLGDGPTCAFSPETESEPDAYGALTAAALGAHHSAIAWSGKGMLRNYGGDPIDTMPELYPRTLAGDPNSAWTAASPPAVVVIHLGTNDFAQGDPGPEFVDRYDAFVVAVRTRYPDATLLAALSPMLSGAARLRAADYLDEVIARAAARGDGKVETIEFAEQVLEELGCDYHPGRLTHQQMAATLTARIRAITGW